MSDFKTRLIEEKAELSNKLDKLNDFIGSENFRKIDSVQMTLPVAKAIHDNPKYPDNRSIKFLNKKDGFKVSKRGKFVRNPKEDTINVILNNVNDMYDLHYVEGYYIGESGIPDSMDNKIEFAFWVR